MFRPPTNLQGTATLSNGLELLREEVLAEQAASLGHHGRKVEAALAALRAWDAGERGTMPREDLVAAAARAVWAYFVQRELCGLRDERQIIREMQIPGEVLNRLGAS
jgi:hypothetical protein